MAILEIIKSPDPLLKKTSSPITKVNKEIQSLMDNMLETMYNENGVGLAAVQIGVLKRIVVIDINYSNSRYSTEKSNNGLENKKPLFLINPKIMHSSKETSQYEEGCLSFPTIKAQVNRPKIVTVQFLDYFGIEKTIKCDNLLGTCIQHEIDHLNGITFVDHLSKLKKTILLKRMHKNISQ